MVVGLIVEEISNVDAKYVKVTGAQNIGQGHRVWNVNVNCVKVNGVQNIGQGHWVSISAKSGGQGDVSCKE